MSLEFEDNARTQTSLQGEGMHGLTAFLLKTKIAKDRKGAEMILIALSVMAFLAAAGFGIWYAIDRLFPQEVSYRLSKQIIEKLPIAAQIEVLK